VGLEDLLDTLDRTAAVWARDGGRVDEGRLVSTFARLDRLSVRLAADKEYELDLVFGVVADLEAELAPELVAIELARMAAGL